MQIEVSNGEIVDKITILKIKLRNIKSKDKLVNIKKELFELLPNLRKIGLKQKSSLFKKLESINLTLWEIEDKLREKELREEFDSDFVKLARKVYYTNDERSEIKRKINIETGSSFIEEKGYADYKKQEI